MHITHNILIPNYISFPICCTNVKTIVNKELSEKHLLLLSPIY